MGQPKAQRCSECGILVAGEPNLYLGGNNTASRLRLCVDCVTTFQTQAGVPSRLHDFIQWYRALRNPQSEISMLRERIEELEALLEIRTTPARG